MDMTLISAFVEQWHLETNSFHFPWGEMTITLHDVFMILGLPIDGRSVVADVRDSDMFPRLAEILGRSIRDVSALAGSKESQ